MPSRNVLTLGVMPMGIRLKPGWAELRWGVQPAGPPGEERRALAPAQVPELVEVVPAAPVGLVPRVLLAAPIGLAIRALLARTQAPVPGTSRVASYLSVNRARSTLERESKAGSPPRQWLNLPTLWQFVPTCSEKAKQTRTLSTRCG